ncbi:hypothetical protein EIP86_002631, partial [Pleurotus ostreatoroseus]
VLVTLAATTGRTQTLSVQSTVVLDFYGTNFDSLDETSLDIMTSYIKPLLAQFNVTLLFADLTPHTALVSVIKEALNFGSTRWPRIAVHVNEHKAVCTGNLVDDDTFGMVIAYYQYQYEHVNMTFDPDVHGSYAHALREIATSPMHN